MIMPTIMLNNKIISADDPCVHFNDRGYTLGHGLFETILVKNGMIPALDHHWQRLVASAPVLDIVLPFTHHELELMLTTLIFDNCLQNKVAVARVTITHGESERGIFPTVAPQPNVLISVFEYTNRIDRPYYACIVNTRKNEHAASSRIKSISYLDNILAKKEALSQGCDEAFLLNTASNIADGSVSNIYLVKNQQIFTPLITDGALPGVVRNILLTEFNSIFQITEKSISPEELMLADEIFLTNALMGVKSVCKVNEHQFHSFEVTSHIEIALREIKNYL